MPCLLEAETCRAGCMLGCERALNALDRCWMRRMFWSLHNGRSGLVVGVSTARSRDRRRAADTVKYVYRLFCYQASLSMASSPWRSSRALPFLLGIGVTRARPVPGAVDVD